MRIFPLICLAVATVGLEAKSQAAMEKPKLVVSIVVDQLRADYLDRYEDLFLVPGKDGRDAGGFRYLREQGARFTDARFRHFPLFTGPGHAVVLTGSYPYKTGIVGNDWYSKAQRAEIYCVQDPQAKVVGGGAASKAKPMSPANLRSTTVGDELKMATGGAAKVISLSLKDRAAILLGGRLTDATIWFDDSTGQWISSNFYRPDEKLPGWVQAVNDRKIPDSFFNKPWSFSPPQTALARLWQPTGVKPPEIPYGMGEGFPHTIANYKAFVHTPSANEFVLETAKQAIISNEMGRDDVPDLLAVNLATNDYVGHTFGTQSPELWMSPYRPTANSAIFFAFCNAQFPVVWMP